MGKASYRSRKQMEEAKKGDKMFKEVKRELEKRAKKKRLAVEEEDIIEEMWDIRKSWSIYLKSIEM